jgi:hypothetical protein
LKNTDPKPEEDNDKDESDKEKSEEEEEEKDERMKKILKKITNYEISHEDGSIKDHEEYQF